MGALLLVLVWFLAACRDAAPGPLFDKQRVTYRSGDLTLVGFVYRPAGPGPFPTVVWNHGSEKNPGGGPQFDEVAKVFVPAGYAVFAPTRRGHGDSQGDYIRDRLDALQQKGDQEGAARLMVQLLESEQLADLLAGVEYAARLPFVDTSRMVVAGCSFGGIETLLAAERDPRFKAALAISPAALAWSRAPPIQRRLTAAAEAISIPVLLIQPPKDASLEPARVLGNAARRAGRTSFVTKVYPATMPEEEQKHCFGGPRGFHNWSAEAISFFDRAIGRAPGGGSH